MMVAHVPQRPQFSETITSRAHGSPVAGSLQLQKWLMTHEERSKAKPQHNNHVPCSSVVDTKWIIHENSTVVVSNQHYDESRLCTKHFDSECYRGKKSKASTTIHEALSWQWGAGLESSSW